MVKRCKDPSHKCKAARVARLMKAEVPRLVNTSCSGICRHEFERLLDDVYSVAKAYMGLELRAPPGDALFGCLCGGSLDWASLLDALLGPAVRRGDFSSESSFSPAEVSTLVGVATGPGGRPCSSSLVRPWPPP